MKVILLQDVPDVGHRGEVQEVSKGFARNYLLRKGLARAASDADEKNAAENAKRLEAQNEANKEKNALLASRLKNANISIQPSNVTSAGKLFGSLSEKDVAEAVQKQLSITLDPKTILLSEPLKKVGSYQAQVILGESRAELTINILNSTK